MRGSHLSNPMICLALVTLGMTTLAVMPAMAADAVGPPTSLLPPPAAAAPAALPHAGAASVASASPGKHPATAVQRAPIENKPVIPPSAAISAKLGLAPQSRPALSLDTELKPLNPASTATSSPGASEEAPPSVAKPPPS
jgi:hypothetical protein